MNGYQQGQLRRFLIAIVSFSTIAGCSSDDSASQPQSSQLSVRPKTVRLPEQFEWESSHPDKPVILIHRYPSYSQNAVAGPIVGIWADGRVIRVQFEDAIGESYVQSTLTDEQQSEIIDYLQAHPELFSINNNNLVLDKASEFFGIRLDGFHFSYNETVGLSQQVKPSPEKAEFLKFLMSLELSDPQPCSAPWIAPNIQIFE